MVGKIFKSTEAFDFLEDWMVKGDATPCFGLLGADISKSFSPMIHYAGADLIGRDIKYFLFEIGENQFEDFLKKAYQAGLEGLNITSPYKANASKLLKSPLPALNTLSRGEKFWQGSMTDIRGLEFDLLRQGIKLFEFPRWIIFGTGDIAASLVYDLISKIDGGETQVNLIGRKKVLFEDWLVKKGISGIQLEKVSWHSYSYSEADFSSLLAEQQPLKSLCIIAAPGAALSEQLEKRNLSPGKIFVNFKGLVCDLNYGDARLFKTGDNASLNYQDGLGMLIEQARLAQEGWFNTSLNAQDYRQAVMRQLTAEEVD